MRRSPWYAITAAGVIALGIALGTTVFAIVDGALFKPLPYRDVDRMFAVSTGWSRLPEPLSSFPVVSEADVREWSAAVPDATLTAFSVADLQMVGTRDWVRCARVDANFFDVIGMSPIGGFAPADYETTVKVRPALVTQSFWRTRLGADPNAIGRTLTDEHGDGVRVVGILPAGFLFPFPAGASWTPELLTPRLNSNPPSRGRSLYVVARLGQSLADREASERLSLAAARVAAAAPVARTSPTASERTRIRAQPYDQVELVPVRGALTESLREKAWIVSGAAAALVLLACLNVTSLTVARIRDRWRDLVVRRSLGASAGDLVRLLAVENALIVSLATVLGVLGARGLLAITVRLITSYLIVLKPPAIDNRVLVFDAIAALGCTALVTFMSARAASRASLRSAIAEGGGTTRRERGRVSIVTGEVAVALVIAVAGALVAGSLIRVWGEDPGFDASRMAVVSISEPAGGSAADIEDLVATVSRLPGVTAAGGVDHAFLEHAFNGSVFDRPAGIEAPQPGSGFPIESVPVTHGYFEAAGLRPTDGRLPTGAEFTSGAPVLVVTDTVARQFWPGRRAIGESLVNQGRLYYVVGVVPDARYMSLDLEPQGEIYWPVAAEPRPHLAYVLVRFDRPGSAALAPIVSQIVQRCPTCWLRRAQMMTAALGASIRPRQFSAWLFSAFGIAALVIVGTGILGLVAMTTNRRRREIGIRMALGATRIVVVRQILREQLASVALGLVIGGIVAAWAVRFVDAYLYKTPTYDPWAWAAAIAALLLISVAGALIPSHHASRIDPVRALRIE